MPVAMIYAALGEKNEALGWLEEGYRVHDGNMAERDTARIFSAIGIRLDWLHEMPNAGESSGKAPYPIKVRIIPDSPQHRSGRVLGVALRAQDNRYLVAYAFYRRIETVADRGGTDPAAVLAHVMAHEIGHLLLPYDSHTSVGIMSRRWDSGRVEGMDRGLLGFTLEQATLIRGRVRAIRPRTLESER